MRRERTIDMNDSSRPRRRTGARAWTGALLAGCLAVLTPAAADAASIRPAALVEPASLLALYDFSETSGTVAHDASAAQRDADVVGGAAWRGGAMQFTGANHVQLPNGLLAGKSAATIVIETTPQALSGAKFLWNFGGSGDASTGQFFIQPVAPRLAISKTNWSGEQTVTSATKLAEGRSQSVAATIEKNANGTTSTLRLFIDGVQVAVKSDSTVNLADLATHTMNYIGKSAYAGDSLYQGSVSTFRVYDAALPVATLAEIATADAQAVAGETVAALDLAAVNAQSLDAVATNLVLPTTGGVTWTSSQPGVIAANGTVVQPEADTAVTLTATATVRGATATRTFDVTVKKAPTAAERAAQAAAVLLLPSVLENGYSLPTTLRGLPVTWTHIDGVGSIDAGVITGAPADGLGSATLDAVIGTVPDTATVRLDVRLTAGTDRLAAYTTSKTTRGGDDPEVTRAAHLALATDGGDYAALNGGGAVVFAQVTGMTEALNGTLRYLAQPYIFRLEGDGGFGLIARRVSASGTPAAGDDAGALLFTSRDLVNWNDHGLLALPGPGTTGRVSAEWDEARGSYRVVWSDAAGNSFSGSTTDFASVTPLGVGEHPAGRTGTIGVAYAEGASILPLTAAEADDADALLGRVHNTGIRQPEAVTVDAGDDIALPEKVTAEYSDGGTHDFRVDWDTSGVDLTQPGTYEITGDLQQQKTVFPLVSRRADPHVLRYTRADGSKTWMYIATDDNGQDEFFIRQADTIEGIATAQDHRILGIGLSGSAPVGSQLWAPEFHEVGGDLYILFAANANNVNAWNGVQSYTMRLKPGGDPLVRTDWEAPQRVVDANGQPLTEYGTGITLDMTTFEDAGVQYAMWSERRVPASGSGPAVLKISEIVPSATGAWKLKGERSTVAYPDRSWSTNTTPVVEGPFVVQRDGRIMVTFSGSGVDSTYAVGLMTAESGADLLDPASWTTRNHPIWHFEGPVSDNWGPGHNSYTYDDDGNLINIFHAKLTAGGSRDSGARMVYFREDGSPILDMTDAEWLTPENRTVTISVTVAATEPALAVTATVLPRCVAGKVVLPVRIDNASGVAVDATVASAHGTITATGIGGSKTVSLSTRAGTVPAGDVTVTATGVVNGAPASIEITAHHAATVCR
ncbi:family 43 glycosylhydrolase [Microbacterium sp. ZW T5_45]|uniref:family 43 glycosylhydrolase n=1 Tax=Microbacterium sp. ZW T5_45 TaxID=3378080 RepID=UPI003854046D